MRNLLEETLGVIRESGHVVDDVAWVGSADGKYAVSWEEFAKMADVEYNEGYGGQEIATDLVVVFSDGTWLERHEYDGSEWWEFKKTPKRQSEARPFVRVCRGVWQTIQEMNDDDLSELCDE